VLAFAAMAPAAGAAQGCGKGATGAAPCLDHVVVMVFENRSYGQVIGSPAAPTFNPLARSGALLTRYYAIAHPRPAQLPGDGLGNREGRSG